jgi:hypothetical protein
VRADDEAKGETEGGGRRLDWELQVINTTQAALGQYEASARDWRSSLLLALAGMEEAAEAQVAQLRGGSRPYDMSATRISGITDVVAMDRFFTALCNATGNTTKTHKRCSSLVLRSWLVSKRILKSKAAPVAEQLAWLPRALSDPGNAKSTRVSQAGAPRPNFNSRTPTTQSCSDSRPMWATRRSFMPTTFTIWVAIDWRYPAVAIPSIPTSET